MVEKNTFLKDADRIYGGETPADIFKKKKKKRKQ
ncbi:hypothetical protein LCGC14_0374520 [marine sediment metagenome]|uniref:Uncharacterized protein n=1 Tax=marine sediment metagenome TaxID=412755 RepID=A0A0F9TMA3_9ZZZZ